MPASYPGSVKSFTTKVDGVDDVQAAHVNDLQLEVNAIETELGTNPKKTSASVSEKIAGVKTVAAVSDILSISAAGVFLGVNNYYGTNVTINDDSVYSFTPGKSIGVLLIHSRNATYALIHGIVIYRTVVTGYTYKIAGHAQLAVTTGVLTGTTGVDGNITVSASDADGKIYIENRHGVTISIGIVLLGE